MTDFQNTIRGSLISILFIALALTGCGGNGGGDRNQVSLKFKAVDGSSEVTCDSILTGFGPDKRSSVGLSDLRFYVSNIRFFDSQGTELNSELASSEFQYVDNAGSVAIVDLTSNKSGSCTNSAIAFSEGTERVNNEVIAFVDSGTIASVSFDVGVPQQLMKKVVNSFTAEGAPSPLNEMYWSWASGYRHFVFNFTVKDGRSNEGEGYLHLGSRDCGGDGATALTDRDSCGFINTPAVLLNGFDPNVNTVTVDVRKALQGLAFVTQIYDSSPPYNLIGSGPGVACHSAPPDAQPDCTPIFSNFGIDTSTGNSTATNDHVFSFQ